VHPCSNILLQGEVNATWMLEIMYLQIGSEETLAILINQTLEESLSRAELTRRSWEPEKMGTRACVLRKNSQGAPASTEEIVGRLG
jgi:hypothetical protein